MVSNPKQSTFYLVLTFSSDWNEGTREQALERKNDAQFVYSVSKVFAEKAVWAFAEEHPDLNITTRKSIYILSMQTLMFE